MLVVIGLDVVVVVVVDVVGCFSTGKLRFGCSATATATTLFDVEPVFTNNEHKR